jgi:hypothetical protein
MDGVGLPLNPSPADPAPSPWDDAAGRVAALESIGVPDYLADRLVAAFDANTLPLEVAELVRETVDAFAANVEAN